MKICLNDLLNQLSYAIDCVEAELMGVSSFHSKRVAVVSIETGRLLGFDRYMLMDLAAVALLHDNALAECIQSEYAIVNNIDKEKCAVSMKEHCIAGEENIRRMPFYKRGKGAILYHHERADGRGPFGKNYKEVPVFARIVHIADVLDTSFDLRSMDSKKYIEMYKFVKENEGVLFDNSIVSIFLKAFNNAQSMDIMEQSMKRNILNYLPEVYLECDNSLLIDISGIFSKMVDYKSEFTSRHSDGIARKAMEMGRYYGYNEDKQTKLYVAGALHDIGKLIINNEILEKPGKLTDQEYLNIKDHAEASYIMLKSIRGMEEIMPWACMHHEKLDGSGYPFGKKADELGHEERLIACLDIYQALLEERPYKKGKTHNEAISILKSMSEDGKIDGNIVNDIDKHFKEDKNNG